MKKSTKGALAAGAAGTLLLGGAGSLAYWTQTDNVAGSDITSGHLRLLSAAPCSDWTLDGDVAAYDSTTQPIVPGDTLTKTCTYTVEMAGDHISATLTASAPGWTSANGLSAELNTTASTFVIGGTSQAMSVPRTLADGDSVTANIVVTFPNTSTVTSSQDLSTHLDDIAVTATQTHTP